MAHDVVSRSQGYVWNASTLVWDKATQATGGGAGGGTVDQGAAGVDPWLVTAASLPLPTLAATSTKQSDGTQKTQIVSGGSAVTQSGSAGALDINLASATVSISAFITNFAGPASAVNITDGGFPITVAQSTGLNLRTVVDSGAVTVTGPVASGLAKVGNPVQIGGVYNTTQPTVIDDRLVEAQSTARGALIVATGVDTFAVQASAGTNLNTSALALEATQLTGNTTLSTISGKLPAYTNTASGTLGALNAAVTLTLDGESSVGIHIGRIDFVGTLTFEILYDTVWVETWVVSPANAQTYNASNRFVNDSLRDLQMATHGAKQVRVRVSLYTSGSDTCSLNGTPGPFIFPQYAGATNDTFPGCVAIGGNFGSSQIKQIGAYNTDPVNGTVGLVVRNMTGAASDTGGAQAGVQGQLIVGTDGNFARMVRVISTAPVAADYGIITRPIPIIAGTGVVTSVTPRVTIASDTVVQVDTKALVTDVDAAYVAGTTSQLTQTSMGRLRVDLEASDRDVDGVHAIYVTDRFQRRLLEQAQLDDYTQKFAQMISTEWESSHRMGFEVR